jgi:hypothetical protein
MLLALAPATALAGADYGSPSGGAFNSDGSGWCSGTLNGFRTSSDAGASLVLEEYTSTSGSDGYIMCRYNGQYKYAPIDYSSTALLNAFSQISTLSHEVHIYVHWDTDGYVDALQVFNASYYH